MVVRITNSEGIQSIQSIVSVTRLEDGSLIMLNLFREEFKIDLHPNNYSNPKYDQLMARFRGCDMNGLVLFQRDDGTYYI